MSEANPRPVVRVLLLVTGALLGLAVFLGARINHPSPMDPFETEFRDLLGRQLPDVAFPALSGAEGIVTTRDSLVRPLLVVFSASGCSQCDQLYPLLAEAAAKVPQLLIATGDRGEMRAKIDQYGMAFPVAFDSLLNSAGQLGVWRYPSAFFMSRDGMVLKAGSGQLAARVVHYALAASGAE